MAKRTSRRSIANFITHSLLICNLNPFYIINMSVKSTYTHTDLSIGAELTGSVYTTRTETACICYLNDS